MTRYTKISADGAALPADAKQWAAVLDTSTHLMWSAKNIGVKSVTQDTAVKNAGKSKLCGFTDWRLPSSKELFTLVDHERYAPAIDTAFFPDCKSDWYWTATGHASNPGFAWGVGFSDGYVYYGHRNSSGFVRAVRSVPPSQ